MTGLHLENLKKEYSFKDLIHKSNKEEFSFYLEEALSGNSQMLETKIKTTASKYIDVQITLIPIFIKEKLTTINVLAKDITEVIQTREQIQFMAYHDSLTQLPNRTYFSEELNNRIKENELPFAVCLLDLDRFKVINDILGHQTGDKLLMALSKRFSSFIKEDIFVARMGGDEFTFLFRNVVSLPDLECKVEELLDLIQKPFLIDNQELYVTGSLGIAIYPEDSHSNEDLMKYADVAMYRAKDKGKNTYEFYHDQLNENNTKRLLLEKDIRRAIKEQQFEIYYQPQIKISTGKIFSMEALIRWNHPEKGLISPGEFIPIAEENGMIHELGEWVLYESCKQVKRWQKEGYSDMQLSVNISFKQLYHQSFINTVESMLNDIQFDPKLLDLEITESMAMKDLEYAKHIFAQLRNLGISISIDDFGTGYSSLNHIKNIPIDRVKVDGSFVRDVPNNQESTIIIKTIMAMTKNLNLLSIAEHVETEDQYNFLKSINCDEIQGFLCSAPLNKKSMSEFLRKSS
jgi:diguanylate cyclase